MKNKKAIWFACGCALLSCSFYWGCKSETSSRTPNQTHDAVRVAVKEEPQADKGMRSVEARIMGNSTPDEIQALSNTLYAPLPPATNLVVNRYRGPDHLRDNLEVECFRLGNAINGAFGFISDINGNPTTLGVTNAVYEITLDKWGTNFFIYPKIENYGRVLSSVNGKLIFYRDPRFAGEKIAQDPRYALVLVKQKDYVGSPDAAGAS